MENDKYFSLGDSYIGIEGVEKEVTQFIDDTLDRKTMMQLTTKSLTKAPVKLTKTNLKNI